jgi:PAS domain S-box-containing protein
MRSLLAALGTRFISISPDEVDSAVIETLSAIGRFAEADRAVLCMFEDEYRRWGVTHEWFAEGMWPLQGQLEHIPPFPFAIEQFEQRRPLDVPSLDALPPHAHGEKELIRNIGLAAVYLLPIHVGEELIGFAGFASRSPRGGGWPRELDALLALPGRMMTYALGRKRSEEALRANQQRWRSLCDCNVVGVFVVNRSDGVLRESNDAGLRMLGRTREELSGGEITSAQVTAPEHQPFDLKALEIIERSGRVLPWEKEIIQPDGTRVPLLATLASLEPYSSDLLSLCIDLSGRRRAEEELKRRNRLDRLHTTLSQRLINLPAAAIEEAVTAALAEVGTVFGFDRIGLYEMTGPNDAAALRSAWKHDPDEKRIVPVRSLALARLPWWRDRLRSGRTVYTPTPSALPPQATAERALLREHNIQGIVAIPLNPGGALRGIVVFATIEPCRISDEQLALLRVFCDIVANALERRRAEEEIRAAEAALERRVHQRRGQLEASNAELEAFAYSVSHDLRAPLRTIGGLSHVLLEDYGDQLDDQARSLIDRMMHATRRMGHLIDGLLQLSRVVRTEVEWHEVNLSALAQELLDQRRAEEPDRSVEIRVQPDIVVRGHARLLRIALEQLIDNAWKFTRQRPVAHIEVGRFGVAPEGPFFVRDNGVGFETEYADKLFGAFQRLHGMDEYEGHGIGLATVQRIVRMHGGQAWADSELNRGAIIFFTLGVPHKANA